MFTIYNDTNNLYNDLRNKRRNIDIEVDKLFKKIIGPITLKIL